MPVELLLLLVLVVIFVVPIFFEVNVGIVAFVLRFGMGQGFRPLLYLVILLVTVGFVLLLAGLNAELVAQLRSEVDRLKRGDRGLQ